MPHRESPVRRRQSEVYRNLDDRLTVLGLLSFKSMGLLGVLYGVFYALDLMGFWKLVFGSLGGLVEFGLLGGSGLLLAFAEKQDDEHLVVEMLRFWSLRPSRFIYSGAKLDGFEEHEVEWLMESRSAVGLPRANVPQRESS